MFGDRQTFFLPIFLGQLPGSRQAILAVKCLAIARRFFSRILDTNRLVTLPKNIGWETGFGINGFEAQNLGGFRVSKLEGRQKDPI